MDGFSHQPQGGINIYQEKLDFLEEYGFKIFNDDGYDYVIDDGIIIPVDDIDDVIKFVD